MQSVFDDVFLTCKPNDASRVRRRVSVLAKRFFNFSVLAKRSIRGSQNEKIRGPPSISTNSISSTISERHILSDVPVLRCPHQTASPLFSNRSCPTPPRLPRPLPSTLRRTTWHWQQGTIATSPSAKGTTKGITQKCSGNSSSSPRWHMPPSSPPPPANDPSPR